MTTNERAKQMRDSADAAAPFLEYSKKVFGVVEATVTDLHDPDENGFSRYAPPDFVKIKELFDNGTSAEDAAAYYLGNCLARTEALPAISEVDFIAQLGVVAGLDPLAIAFNKARAQRGIVFSFLYAMWSEGVKHYLQEMTQVVLTDENYDIDDMALIAIFTAGDEPVVPSEGAKLYVADHPLPVETSEAN